MKCYKFHVPGVSACWCVYFAIVCNQASLGVAAIFGPKSTSLAGYINSMCSTLEIPHIEARLEPKTDRERQIFSINVHPQAMQLSRSYVELLKEFHWNKFCVIYGDHSGTKTIIDKNY